MNKEEYITPMMEIIEFECEDIITTSGFEKEDQPPVVTPIPNMVPYPDPVDNG